MHRRQFLNTAALAAATLPLASLSARAQTPTGDGSETLAGRVAAIAPEALLGALLTTPVTTPLVPRDTPDIEPMPWEDESDTDLDGMVGGVLFQTGWDSRNNPLVMSTAIIAPDDVAATNNFQWAGPDEVQELYGMPFYAQNFGDYAIAVVQVGNLLLAGGAEAPDEIAGGPGMVASPVAASGSGRIHLRALANLAATLDHLEDVLATLDA